MNTVMQEQKRQFLIERLAAKKVFKTQTGRSIYKADYDELLYELVIDAFRDIDIQNENNKWF